MPNQTTPPRDLRTRAVVAADGTRALVAAYRAQAIIFEEERYVYLSSTPEAHFYIHEDDYRAAEQELAGKEPME